MDNKLLLAKCITLLYQESKLSSQNDNSAALVRSVLDTIKVSEVSIGLNTVREFILALKTTIVEMCSMPVGYQYDRFELLQRIKVNTLEDESMFSIIEEGITDNLSIEQVQSACTAIRKSIQSHFKNQQVQDILHKANYSIKFQPEKITDVNQFIKNIINQLEPLQTHRDYKDPAIMESVRVSETGSMTAAISRAQAASNGDRLYKTGWSYLDKALGGGIRQGTCTVVNALEFNYKTGATLSIFEQIALCNKPLTQDPTKKPLMLRISFEDDLDLNIKFMYESLRYTETREYVSLTDVSKEAMGDYIKRTLSVNGFEIDLIRVDPAQWTYKDIFDMVLDYEIKGYAVEVLVVDYLSKLPTTGCIITGPMGTDICDLFSRMRNFCAGKNITFITPHQLSTEAKMLSRTAIAPSEFVKEVAGKGYYERTKALGQIVDCELFVHVVKHNGEAYLAVQKGKHKGAPIVEEEEKYFLIKFPKGMPIPLVEQDGEVLCMRKLPSAASNVSDDFFNM